MFPTSATHTQVHQLNVSEISRLRRQIAECPHLQDLKTVFALLPFLETGAFYRSSRFVLWTKFPKCLELTSNSDQGLTGLEDFIGASILFRPWLHL
jgi:hypothetical protein